MTRLVLHSRKLFLMILPLLFEKWVGKHNPSYFVEGIIISHGIALASTKLIDSYSPDFVTLLFATVFNYWNEPENRLIAKLILPHRKVKRVIFPLFWLISFGFISKSIKCT